MMSRKQNWRLIGRWFSWEDVVDWFLYESPGLIKNPLQWLLQLYESAWKRAFADAFATAYPRMDALLDLKGVGKNVSAVRIRKHQRALGKMRADILADSLLYQPRFTRNLTWINLARSADMAVSTLRTTSKGIKLHYAYWELKKMERCRQAVPVWQICWAPPVL